MNSRLIDELRAAMELFKNNCITICREVMASEKGINDPKTMPRMNTLINSNLYNEIEGTVEDIDLYKILVNDYIVNVEQGMQRGTWVNANVIIAWAQRKNIPTSNSVIYLIRKKIYEYGITPRPLWEGNQGIWQEIDDYFSDMADDIYNIFLDEINRIAQF